MANLKEMNLKRMTFTLESTSPLIQHKWSEKAKKQLRDKGQKTATTKNREARNPEKEAHDATHFTADGKYGIPLMAFKASMIGAAHKDIGLEKTLLRKSVFFECSDPEMVVEIETPEPIIREDMVRVGAGSADIRYRPEFRKWKAKISCVFDNDLIAAEDILNLANRAGFGIGLLEWRPEKGGDYGRYKVSAESGVVMEDAHG